jgi:hypothetical protein
MVKLKILKFSPSVLPPLVNHPRYIKPSEIDAIRDEREKHFEVY